MFIIFENIASYLASVESKTFDAKCFDFAIHGMYEYIVVLVLCQIRDKTLSYGWMSCTLSIVVQL